MKSFSPVRPVDIFVVGQDKGLLTALVDFFPADIPSKALSVSEFELIAEELVNSTGHNAMYVFVCSSLPLYVNDFLAIYRDRIQINQIGVLLDEDLRDLWPSLNLFGIRNIIWQSDIREQGKQIVLTQFNSWIR